MDIRTLVIINEQHKLLDQQRIVLDKKFPNWELLKVPSTGWTLEEMKGVVMDIVEDSSVEAVVCVSPIPYIIRALAEAEIGQGRPILYLFHNDKSYHQKPVSQAEDGRHGCCL